MRISETHPNIMSQPTSSSRELREGLLTNCDQFLDDREPAVPEYLLRSASRSSKNSTNSRDGREVQRSEQASAFPVHPSALYMSVRVPRSSRLELESSDMASAVPLHDSLRMHPGLSRHPSQVITQRRSLSSTYMLPTHDT